MNEQERHAAFAALAKEAIDVQDASNLSGVVHGFSRAMTKLCELVSSTDERAHHPITVLWSNKIASLCASDDPSVFSWAYGACQGLVEGKQHGPHPYVAPVEPATETEDFGKPETD